MKKTRNKPVAGTSEGKAQTKNDVGTMVIGEQSVQKKTPNSERGKGHTERLQQQNGQASHLKRVSAGGESQSLLDKRRKTTRKTTLHNTTRRSKIHAAGASATWNARVDQGAKKEDKPTNRPPGMREKKKFDARITQRGEKFHAFHHKKGSHSNTKNHGGYKKKHKRSAKKMRIATNEKA